MSESLGSGDKAHPLKRLRKIIGASQQSFAEITGIHLDTVRAIEIRRRAKGALSSDQLSRIWLTLGTTWDEATNQWIFLSNHLENENRLPYTKELFQSFREELKAEAHDRAGMIYYLLLRLMRFCESLPSKQFNGWFWRLEQQLDEWGAETVPLTLSPIWNQEQMRMQGYRKGFPYLLKGEEKEFADLIERMRAERENLIKSGLLKPLQVPVGTRVRKRQSPLTRAMKNAQRSQAQPEAE
jgi:hypothetical protein